MLRGSGFSYTLPRSDRFLSGIVTIQDITKQFSKASKSSSQSMFYKYFVSIEPKYTWYYVGFKQALPVSQCYVVLHMTQFSKSICFQSVTSSPSKKDGTYLIRTFNFQGVICCTEDIAETFNRAKLFSVLDGKQGDK